jgi:hypothetical protein
VSKIGESIIRGLKQALAIAEWTAPEGSYVVHTPEEIVARQEAKRREALEQNIKAPKMASTSTRRR